LEKQNLAWTGKKLSEPGLDSFQKIQKIPEELLAYEVIVDQTVVLLSRIFSIDAVKGA